MGELEVSLMPVNIITTRLMALQDIDHYQRIMDTLEPMRDSISGLGGVLNEIKGIINAGLSDQNALFRPCPHGQIDKELYDLQIHLHFYSKKIVNLMISHFANILSFPRAVFLCSQLLQVSPEAHRQELVFFMQDRLQRLAEDDIELIKRVYQRHRMRPPNSWVVPLFPAAMNWLQTLQRRLTVYPEM